MNNKSSNLKGTKLRSSDRLDIQNELSDPELTKALEESQRQHEFGEVGTEEVIFKILRGEEPK